MLTAVHEAGHAVACYLLGVKVDRVLIHAVPSDVLSLGGGCMHQAVVLATDGQLTLAPAEAGSQQSGGGASETPEGLIPRPARLSRALLIALAGPAAEGLLSPPRGFDDRWLDPTTPVGLACRYDAEKARSLAGCVKPGVPGHLDRYLRAKYAQAQRLLLRHWGKVNAVAIALNQRRELSGEG
jgi:hypothetical protein